MSLGRTKQKHGNVQFAFLELGFLLNAFLQRKLARPPMASGVRSVRFLSLQDDVRRVTELPGSNVDVGVT